MKDSMGKIIQALIRCSAPLIFVAFMLPYTQKVQSTEIIDA